MISKSLVSLTVLLLGVSPAFAFPRGSFSGLSAREWNKLVARSNEVDPPSPPGPLTYNGTKLVHDSAHPFQAPGQDDIRGPCPGLNTLANHGVSSVYFSLIFVRNPAWWWALDVNLHPGTKK